MNAWLCLAVLAAGLAPETPLEQLVGDGQLSAASRALASRPWPRQALEARAAACRLLLFENRSAEAVACLNAGPPDAAAATTQHRLLAEAFARQGDWRRAAEAYAAAGQESAAARAAEFARQPPFPGLPSESVTLPFVRRDPLPVLHVRIGGGPELNFILDTGAGDTVIDPKLAAEIGVRRFGSAGGTFAGGKTAPVETGILDEMSLGALSLKRVPVVLLDTARFKAAAGGLPVSGVIGMGVLSRFLATIDYPRSQLVLRRAGERAPASPRAQSLPMWLAGDHFVLVEGALNGTPQLSFIDTGLAGAGCTAPASSLEMAKLSPSGTAFTGQGGGGAVTVSPFVAPSVSLGPVRVNNLPCLAGAFPPSLERSQGTRIGLLVSHAALTGYAVTFDFRRMRLTLDPAA